MATAMMTAAPAMMVVMMAADDDAGSKAKQPMMTIVTETAIVTIAGIAVTGITVAVVWSEPLKCNK
jgi:hypothetical protein